MVKKTTIFVICCISVVSLKAFEQGDRIVSSKTITKPNDVTIYEGQIYEVVRVTSSGLPVLNTEPQVWISSREQAHFETLQNYSKYQNFTESIAFGSGALLFLVFAKGFNASFPI